MLYSAKLAMSFPHLENTLLLFTILMSMNYPRITVVAFYPIEHHHWFPYKIPFKMYIVRVLVAVGKYWQMAVNVFPIPLDRAIQFPTSSYDVT